MSSALVRRWIELDLPPRFLLIVLAQVLGLLVLLAAPEATLIVLAGVVTLSLFLLLPLPFGIGAFVLAGAYVPFLYLRWRFYLGVLAVILALVLLAELVRLIRVGRFMPDRTELTRPVQILLAVVVLGIAIGIARGATVEEWPLEAFPYFCLALAPVAARHLTLHSMHRIFSIFTIMILVQSVVAVIFFAQGGYLRIADPRFSIHPSFAGVVLFAIAAFHPKKRWRVLAAFSILPITLQLVSSMTRGYWLGFLTGLAVVLIAAFLRLPRKRFRELLVRIAFVLVCAFAVGLYVVKVTGLLESLLALGQRFQSLSDLGTDASTRVRMIEWEFAYQEFLRRPIFGNGFGFHLEFFHPTHLRRIPQWWFIHNSYLLLLVKVGLVGTTAFLLFLAGVLRVAFRAIRRVRDPLAVCFAVGFAANVIQFLAVAITNYTFCKSVNMTYLAFILGALAVLSRGKPIEEPGPVVRSDRYGSPWS